MINLRKVFAAGATMLALAGPVYAAQGFVPLNPSGIGVDLGKPPIAASTNGSTSITTGGSFQQFLAASTTRLGCYVRNPDTATETLLVDIGETLTVSNANPGHAIPLAPGGWLNCSDGLTIEGGQINVEAATTGHAFVGLSK